MAEKSPRCEKYLVANTCHIYLDARCYLLLSYFLNKKI